MGLTSLYQSGPFMVQGWVPKAHSGYTVEEGRSGSWGKSQGPGTHFNHGTNMEFLYKFFTFEKLPLLFLQIYPPSLILRSFSQMPAKVCFGF